MKFLKLFENFDEPSISSNLVFDWLPFDGKDKDPIQSSIPQSLKLDELLMWVNEKNSSGEASMYEDAGLYISHDKKPGGGFNRVILDKLSPVNFKMDVFNADYQKVQSFDKINPMDVGDISKGASLLNKFGLFNQDE